MNIKIVGKQIERLITANSPIILTGIGVVGVVTTAYLTGKASFKAAEILSTDSRDRAEFSKTSPEILRPRSTADEVKLLWKLYMPAVGVGTLTIASVVGAQYINSRRAAALVTAYLISDKAATEYKDKVLQTLGVKEEQKIEDSLAKDLVANNSTLLDDIVATRYGNVLFIDGYSRRPFRSSMQAVLAAQNYINDRVLKYKSAELTEFFAELGLEATAYSDEVGWSQDGHRLEIKTSATITDKGEPAIVLNYHVGPTGGKAWAAARAL